MKKNKAFFAISIFLVALSISACNLLPNRVSRPSSQSEESEVKYPEAYKIYQLYVADGGTLTYEEWLESIRGVDGKDGRDGVDGKDGHSPIVTIGENGNWFIDGKDSGVNSKGEAGKSAYEIYKEAHPEYNKSEKEWLDDLVNGRLATIEEHTVTFNSNGGSEISSQKVKHGEKVNKPADPSKEGFTFSGWTYLGEPWSFVGYVVTEDMTLLANWEAIDYVATFVNEDGTVLDIQENVHYGDVLTYQGETPNKVNPKDHYVYSFAGWDQDLVVKGDMTFKAVFNEEYTPFEEKYLDAEGNVIYSRYVKEGEQGNFDITSVGIALPSKANTATSMFQFHEWNKASEANNVVTYKPVFMEATIGLEFDNNIVKNYVGNSKEVVVPSYWNKKEITSISNTAFVNNIEIESVSLPDGIRTIPSNSFANCTNLKSFTFPSSLTSIGNEAFMNCSMLASVDLPDSLNSIGDSCFLNCLSLTSVNLPKISKIENNTFSGCKALEIVVFPETITVLGMGSFLGTNLKTIDLCNVTQVLNGAFAECKNLTEVNITPSVKFLDSSCFRDCTSLTKIFIPGTVETMGEIVFNNCTSLTIYCGAESKPRLWDPTWNGNCNSIVWGYNLKEYIFEAEYTNLESKEGLGYSGTASGKDMVCSTDDCSYVTYLYEENASINFFILAEDSVDDAVLSLRLGGEFMNVKLDPSNYHIRVDHFASEEEAASYYGNFDSYLQSDDTSNQDFYIIDNWDCEQININAEGLYEPQLWDNYQITSKLRLKKGVNCISLITANSASPNMGTMSAIAPVVDYISIKTSIALSMLDVTDNGVTNVASDNE